MERNVDLVVNDTGHETGRDSFWNLGYEYVSKPGYRIAQREYGDGVCISKKKGSPGGDRAYGETFCALRSSQMTQSDLEGVEQGLWFWDPKKVNTKESLADLIGLKIASRCEYMRRVGEGVPEWVEVADRREGDWMVPCIILEGGVIVYPKSPKCEIVETEGCGEECGLVAHPYAWSSSGPPRMFGVFDEYTHVSEGLLKSAIHTIKIASKVNPSEKPKRKADDPAADGETPEKKPKADSAVEKKEKAKTTSTSSPSARSAEVIDLTKEDD